MDDTRVSVARRGELRFAESRRVAETQTPEERVSEMEGRALVERMEELAEKLAAASQGQADQDRLDALESAYEEALADWEAWAASGPEVSYLSLKAAIAQEAVGSGETLSPEGQAQRLASWDMMMEFFLQGGGSDLSTGFKNFLAVARRVGRWKVTATQAAALLGETKAAVSAREIRLCEKPLKQAGALGYLLLGGSKAPDARLKYAEAQQGNTNRRRSGKRKLGVKR